MANFNKTLSASLVGAVALATVGVANAAPVSTAEAVEPLTLAAVPLPPSVISLAGAMLCLVVVKRRGTPAA